MPRPRRTVYLVEHQFAFYSDERTIHCPNEFERAFASRETAERLCRRLEVREHGIEGFPVVGLRRPFQQLRDHLLGRDLPLPPPGEDDTDDWAAAEWHDALLQAMGDEEYDRLLQDFFAAGSGNYQVVACELEV